MLTKTQEVINLVNGGEYKKALQICKDWIYSDPEYRDQLRLGYECLVHPRFYKMLGYDVDKEYNHAVEILKRVYSKIY